MAFRQGHNNPAKRKIAEAQAAAPPPGNDIASQAAAAQAAKMDQQEPAAFDRAAFKAALLAKIASITPKNLEQADEFKKSGGAASVKGAVTGEVQASKEGAQGAIKTANTEAPDASGAQPKAVTPQPPTEAGPPPAEIGAAGAAPKPKSEGEVSMQAESQSLDQQMSDAKVTDEQLSKSNEPEFEGAVAAKGEAQKHAAEAPAVYREQEASVIAGAENEAVAGAALQTTAMHGVRKGQFGKISTDQLDTQQADKDAREQVGKRIEEIFADTRTKVEARLARLDKEVNDRFDQGAEQARQDFETYVDERMRAYKWDRYIDRIGGSLLWAKDKLFGMPDEVNQFYVDGRERYVAQMDLVIDDIATMVETGLHEAKQLIAAGKSSVDEYVRSLPDNLQQLGEEKAEGVQAKFDTLKASVDEKGTQLVDQLAQKYVANLGKLDERINEMKAENRGLIDKAKDAIKAVINTIIGLKNLLFGIIAKAAAAIDKIIGDPIGFLGNLVAGVKAGLSAFMSNIGSHLKKGLMEWLFGALAGAGIQLPETFDLKGIISLVLQVLGLTYANFRARAVAILGEPLVKGLETAAEVFKVLVTEGISGLWRFIQDKVGDIKSMIMDAILAFVRDRIIIAGITWLIGLLNPASAFIKACKAIYDIIMFFVNRGSQIIALVNAVVDSIAAIANGAIGVAATFVENALARAIPVAIGFLASLLGLGDISGTIRSTIQKAQSPVNSAMDWVIHQAVKLVKAAGAFIGGLFGGKKDKGKKDDEPDESDPEKAAKVEAGLAAIDAEEQQYIDEGSLTREAADEVAASVKKKHPVFTSLAVIDGGDSWDYTYTASPGKTKEGEKKAKGDGEAVITVVGNTPPPSAASNLPVAGMPLSSAVGDVSFTAPTGSRKTDPTPREAERQVGQKLSASKNLPIQQGPLDFLSTEGQVGTPIPGSMLIEQPVVTAPDQPTYEGGRFAPLGSVKPDFVLLSPTQVEVFEVTLDASFSLKPAEKGMHTKKGQKRAGDPHKRIQIAATVEYLARRFPNVPIVYNIQTHGGELPDELRKLINTQLFTISSVLRAKNLSNPVQIVWRG